MVVKSLEVLRIVEWLNEMEIENYIINDDLSVDVDGIVWLYNKSLTEIPVQFNTVSGAFICLNNQLTSLKGCPRVVGDSFNCSFNQLTSLKGAPIIVGKSFYCGYNKIEFNVEDVNEVCKVGEGIYV